MTSKRLPLSNATATGFAIGFALLTIIGLLADEGSVPALFSSIFLQLVTVVLAFAVLVGIVNLFLVHLERIGRLDRRSLYSLLVIVTGTAVIVVHILDRARFWSGNLEGEALSPRLFRVTQFVVESALAGLLFFFLTYAAYRLLRRRFSWTSLLFLAVVLVVLVGRVSLEGTSEIEDIYQWLMEVPVTAGTRGLLIGIALGTVVVGLRVLIGQERAYRES